MNPTLSTKNSTPYSTQIRSRGCIYPNYYERLYKKFDVDSNKYIIQKLINYNTIIVSIQFRSMGLIYFQILLKSMINDYFKHYLKLYKMKYIN